MGLFGPKPLYKYKPLEKYKVDIEKENDEFQRTDKYHRLAKYKLVGETEKYRIYYFKGDNTSSTYLLRQDKHNTKKVVFLGNAKTNMCVFANKVFAIDRINYASRAYHPLYCIDIETCNCGEMDVLSNKGCYIAMHYHCQDCVESIETKDNSVIVQVTRYKEGSHYEEECKYQIVIRNENNEFYYKVNGLLPKENVPAQDKSAKRQVKVGDVITVNILDPLGGLSAEDFLLHGNDGSNDVRKEQWTLKQNLFELYQRFADEETGELYVVIYYEEGKKKQICVPREKWEEGRRTVYNS
ncbi:MAG: hypothetical protein J6B86_06550 [Clostridia bacterium]|nr:hypothetical protein [Clostridia bacterium]